MNRFWDPILREIVEAASARCLLEVGVAAGLMTAKLLAYCAASGAVLHAIDPRPEVDVDEWRERHADRLIFHQTRSLDVLADIHNVDVALIDGDHNWFTVHHELKILEETALTDGTVPPVVALHDVGWPYGRRDEYYVPESVPEAYRHPSRKLGLVPGQDELVDGGMNWHVHNAITERAPHNGVRTAIEEFAAQSRLDWRLFYLAGFHGLGIAVTSDRLASNESLRAVIESMQTTRFLDRWTHELELARIRAEIEASRVPELELRISELEHGLSEARGDAEIQRAEAVQARAQARELDQRVSAAERVLADVLSSPSWRVTKPIRGAKHSALRLRGILRQRAHMGRDR